ncbi:hypothetical protein [Halomicrococcus gelatinilyticus]|uniref:hypothetical protein n=1 Tax=Halomicrococcus gelatinilyticus TaxID=1702103 RepID=UPI002E0E94AE
MSDANDDADRDRRDRLQSRVLPALGLCCVAYLATSHLGVLPGGIDYVGATLGVGLMVAGAVRFLRPRRDAGSPERTGESGANEE